MANIKRNKKNQILTVVYLDEATIKTILKIARKKGTTRSAFIRTATEEKIIRDYPEMVDLLHADS